MQKSETDADPPWGDGEQARKSLLKKHFLLLLLLQYQQIEISKTSWSLYGMKPRSYNFPNFLNFTGKGDPLGDLNSPEATFEE